MAQDRRRCGLGGPLLFPAVCGDDVELQDRVRIVEAKLGDRAADGDALVDLVEDRRRMMREGGAGRDDEDA
jgi:hypothetical protein